MITQGRWRRAAMVLLAAVVVFAGFLVIRQHQCVVARAKAARLIEQSAAARSLEHGEALLAQALKYDPGNLRAQSDLAGVWELYSEQTDRMGASSEFCKSLSKWMAAVASESRGSGRLWAAAAYQSLSMHDVSRAYALTQHAIRLGNLDGLANASVGRTLVMRGDYARGLPYLLKAGVKGLTQSDNAVWCLVEAGKEQRRLPEVTGRLKLLLTRPEKPCVSSIGNALIQAYVAAGDYADAVREAAKLGRARLLDIPASISSSFAAFELGKSAVAKRLLLSGGMPVTPSFGLMQAILLTTAGKPKDALNRGIRSAVCIELLASGNLPGWEDRADYFRHMMIDLGYQPVVPTAQQLWPMLLETARGKQPRWAALSLQGCAEAMVGNAARAKALFSEVTAISPDSEPARSYLRTGSLRDWFPPAKGPAEAAQQQKPATGGRER